jgi:hypothetical protein
MAVCEVANLLGISSGPDLRSSGISLTLRHKPEVKLHLGQFRVILMTNNLKNEILGICFSTMTKHLPALLCLRMNFWLIQSDCHSAYYILTRFSGV